MLLGLFFCTQAYAQIKHRFISQTQVLGDTTSAASAPSDFQLTVNVPAHFSAGTTFDQGLVLGDSTLQSTGAAQFATVTTNRLTASNILYSLKAGSGISITDGQTPTITNTGILTLAAGSGITVDGNKITNSGIISLTAGSGISVSGSTITNSDLGSSQKIFKTISVSGQNDIVAGSNTDTFTVAAGSGVSLTTDSTNYTVPQNQHNRLRSKTYGEFSNPTTAYCCLQI